MDPITYTFDGFTFTLNLDGSGNVVSIIIPTIGPVQGSEVDINPSIPINTAEAYAQGIVNLILGL